MKFAFHIQNLRSKMRCEQALKSVDSVHASADQYVDGGTLKKQLKDASRAVFPATIAGASSDEQPAMERTGDVSIATPRLPVMPEWGCVRIDHHSAKYAWHQDRLLFLNRRRDKQKVCCVLFYCSASSLHRRPVVVI